MISLFYPPIRQVISPLSGQPEKASPRHRLKPWPGLHSLANPLRYAPGKPGGHPPPCRRLKILQTEITTGET
jgi:hypothetical protein